MQRTAVISACTLVGLLALGAPSAAQIYKWTDASGTIHFSDTPPSRTAGSSTVEVLPETQHRPAATRRPSVSADEAEPPEQAVVPPPDQGPDNPGNDSATEPEQETVGSDTIIVDDAHRDPAVWHRANSPRNRPGQPIRQPIRPARRGR